MRCLSPLAVFVAALSAGCSAFVAGSGRQLGTLTDRNMIHERYGAPLASGKTDDGLEFEDYVSHRKLSRAWNGEYILFSFICTAGLSELYYLPSELFIAGRQMVLGYHLRFIYNPDGTVKGVGSQDLEYCGPFLVWPPFPKYEGPASADRPAESEKSK